MARCPNKNTGEYRALQSVYKTELRTNDVIIAWQNLNNTDIFPTVLEADEMVKNQKIAFALKQQDFADSLLTNLRRERIGSMYQGEFFLNNSNPATREYDEMFLSANLKKLQRYLEINNIPASTVSIKRTPKSYIIKVNDDLLTSKDIIEKSRSWDTPRSRAVVMHLKKMFPQVNVKMLSVAKGRELYESLPEWKKNNVKYNEVNSFYNDGVAYLIKGRVTDETAIEEMLHPFVDAIKVENEELFNTLLGEVTTNFPEMVQEIEAAYNSDTRNFSDVERDLEIVTQGLSRHFKKEYEETPTQGFLKKIEEVLEWFKRVINNLNEYLTGRPLSVADINVNTNMTDIAKLLNTEGIQFKLEKRVDGKVRFSLTPQKQRVIDSALSRANKVQEVIIKKLFHQVTSSDKEFDSLSANVNNGGDGSTIVTLNKEDHTYVDITGKEIYTSVTTKIKGKLANQEDVQLNLDVGNDVDLLLDAITGLIPLEEVIDDMIVLEEEVALKTYNSLDDTLKVITGSNDIALSQVVLFDEATKTAGTADILIITEEGKIKIADLKTSKNKQETLTNDYKKSGTTTKLYYDLGWIIKPDSALYDSSLTLKDEKGRGILSTREQHNLQVNLYARMLENMGYELYPYHRANTTIHYTADITGKKKNQVFNGNIKFDTINDHPPQQNADLVNFLIPAIKDNGSTARLNEEINKGDSSIWNGKDQLENDENESDKIAAAPYPEYNTIDESLDRFQKALIKKKDVKDALKDKVFRNTSRQKEEEQIALTIAFINIARTEGPIAQSTTYTQLLLDSLRKVNDFIDYVQDPNNFGKTEYITYALNFDRFMSTFAGLTEIENTDVLNATQRKLVLNLTVAGNKLSGIKGKSDGLIGEAINNFVKEIIRTRSSNAFGQEGSSFTMKDLEDLIKSATDISTTDLMTRDMATSPDVILAVMDKIFKSKKQEMLEEIAQRERIITAAANKVIKLTPAANKNTAWDYMQVFDKEGNFTGFYVKKIGEKYNSIQTNIQEKLYDNDGTPYKYHDITDLENAKQQDIDYNINLAYDKAELSKFFRAEEKDDQGNLKSGEFHEYTQEFKNARNKLEYWVAGSKENPFGNWYRKPRVSDQDYALYEAKYFEVFDYTKAVKVGGVPLGTIIKDQTFRAPKVEYRVALETSNPVDGVSQDMTSEQYRKIMNPTDALGQAQKEFYDLYVEMFENDLLKKLPGGTLNQMLGRVPLVKSNVTNQLKEKSPFFVRLYANMVPKNGWNIFKKTSVTKGVALNEKGEQINSMPVFFTGRPRVEGEIEKVDKEVTALQELYKAGGINLDTGKTLNRNDYDIKMAALEGRLARLRSTPTSNEISRDLPSSLLQFSAMATAFETMGTIDDTLRAMVKVLKNREYRQPDPRLKIVATVKGVVQNVGLVKGETDEDSNTVRRAKKWMKMVYYDNEQINKGMGTKFIDGIIQLSSLSYVAFNPFGNFNNYVIGRVNNNIEMIGSRFYSKSSFFRAGKEFNKRALFDVMSRAGHAATDIGDILTAGQIPGLKKSTYDVRKPNSKYEGFVDSFRMMDKMSDIRESSEAYSGNKSLWGRFTEWGYVMQDAAEYNVQTKVGMAMLMDIDLYNEEGGSLSLYDAFEFDANTHQNVLKEGYNKIKWNGVIQDYTDTIKFDIRNKIREVNKQIHGNYAKEDRMVIQQYTIGNLAVQFKKWVAPAIRARYQREYFDQNLGWMEGRYISAWSFVLYVKEQIVKGNMSFNTYNQGFMESQTDFEMDGRRYKGYDGKGGNADQRAQNKLLGFYRTMGDVGLILSTVLLSTVLQAILANEDDDDDFARRSKNLIKYQADRARQELILFTPTTGGASQVYQFFDSPIAASRTMGELANFLQSAISTPMAYLRLSDDEFRLDSRYVYQKGNKKGQLKVYKEAKDVLPIIYSIQKWDSYLTNDDFFIK
tara:strand:+ start:32003 stop:37783 length:5781 start_codon:yes stop_codon:yes gene_type:complete